MRLRPAHFVVNILEDDKIVAGKDSLYASAVIDKKSGELIIKFVNSSSASQQVELNIGGVNLIRKNAIKQVLAANDLYSYNKLSELDKLSPVEGSFEVRSNKINQQLLPYSVNVFRIAYSKK